MKAKNCGWARRRESAALDGLLDPESERDFREHLQGCEVCRRRYRELSLLQAVLFKTERPAVPATLQRRVRAIWRPTLRLVPALQLHPYFRHLSGVAPRRQLRWAGHLAGLALTSICFLLILQGFGDFHFNYARLARPGVYTLLAKPGIPYSYYPNRTEVTGAGAATDSFQNEEVSLESARLNDYVLSIFANGENQELREDSFSIITTTSAVGRGAIEGILHSPRDPQLFLRFGQLLSASQFVLPQESAQSRRIMIWEYRRIFVTG